MSRSRSSSSKTNRSSVVVSHRSSKVNRASPDRCSDSASATRSSIPAPINLSSAWVRHPSRKNSIVGRATNTRSSGSRVDRSETATRLVVLHATTRSVSAGRRPPTANECRRGDTLPTLTGDSRVAEGPGPDSGIVAHTVPLRKDRSVPKILQPLVGTQQDKIDHAATNLYEMTADAFSPTSSTSTAASPLVHVFRV